MLLSKFPVQYFLDKAAKDRLFHFTRKGLALLVLVFWVSAGMSVFQHVLAWMQTWPLHWRPVQVFLLAPVLFLTHWMNRRFFSAEPAGVSGLHQLFSEKNAVKSYWSGGWNFPLAWLSHAAGASVGREGVALQWGAFLGYQSAFSRFFSKEQAMRLGMGAGFSAMFGTPVAGLIFVLEVFSAKWDSWHFLVNLAVSCGLAAWISHLFGVQHMVFPTLPLHDLSGLHFLAFLVIVSGAMLWKRLFYNGLIRLTRLFSGWFQKSIWTTLGIGLVLSVIWLWPALYPYQGLGTNVFGSFFSTSAPWDAFIWKGVATVLCLALGFKGGEATPLFFIGAAWGSFVGASFSIDLAWPTALGTTLLFSMAFRAPVACSLLAASWFGWACFPLFLLFHWAAQLKFPGEKPAR